MDKKKLVENLLNLMPYWHNKVIRPFKKSLEASVSLEMYYCLQILRYQDILTMSELGRLVGTPKQQTTKTVQKLFEYGFVERRFDQSDRRVTLVAATPKAVEYIEHCYRHGMDFLKEFEEKLGAKEARELEEAVETIYRILSKLEE